MHRMSIMTARTTIPIPVFKVELLKAKKTDAATRTVKKMLIKFLYVIILRL